MNFNALLDYQLVMEFAKTVRELWTIAKNVFKSSSFLFARNAGLATLSETVRVLYAVS